MIHCNWSLVWIMKMDFNYNFEFTPARLANLVWGLHYNAILICVAFMQFKVDFFDITRHIFVVVGLYVYGPLMGMTVFLTLFAKVTGYVAVDYRLHNTSTLKYHIHVVNVIYSILYWPLSALRNQGQNLLVNSFK